LVKKERKIDYVDAEHAPEERLVSPSLWPSLSVHVVASPDSHGAPEARGGRLCDWRYVVSRG
jgi:hypothetical protein